MSYCRKEGKDEIIFVTQDDYDKQTPDNPLLPDDAEPEGLIKENGEINWDCPCLQGMADGPCGESFKDAFSCFHYSESEPKGVDCLEQFKSMQECFVQHPDIYGGLDDDLKEEEKKEGDESTQGEEVSSDVKETTVESSTTESSTTETTTSVDSDDSNSSYTEDSTSELSPSTVNTTPSEEDRPVVVDDTPVIVSVSEDDNDDDASANSSTAFVENSKDVSDEKVMTDEKEPLGNNDSDGVDIGRAMDELTVKDEK